MRNKKLTKRRNDITQRWQFCSTIALEKEGDKRKENGITTRGIRTWSHIQVLKGAEQGLTWLNGRNMLLSLW